MSDIILIRNPELNAKRRRVGAAEKLLIGLLLKRAEELFNDHKGNGGRKVNERDLGRLKKGMIIDYKAGVIPFLGDLLILDDDRFKLNIVLIFSATSDEEMPA